jgi:hypothetical protein
MGAGVTWRWVQADSASRLAQKAIAAAVRAEEFAFMPSVWNQALAAATPQSS